MKQTGRVLSISGDRAVVSVMRTGMCGEHCASCKSNCAPTSKTVTAYNPIGAKPGNMVSVSTPDNQVLLGAALVYLVPVILMFATYLVTYRIWNSEPAGIVCSFCTLITVFLSFRYIDKRLQKSGRYQIKIDRIYDERGPIQ